MQAFHWIRTDRILFYFMTLLLILIISPFSSKANISVITPNSCAGSLKMYNIEKDTGAKTRLKYFYEQPSDVLSDFAIKASSKDGVQIESRKGHFVLRPSFAGSEYELARARIFSLFVNSIVGLQVQRVRKLDLDSNSIVKTAFAEAFDRASYVQQNDLFSIGNSITNAEGFFVAPASGGMIGQGYLNQKLGSFDQVGRNSLEKISSLPKNQVQVISSLWLLYNIFGYPKFTPQNWLIDGENIIGLTMNNLNLTDFTIYGSYNWRTNPLMHHGTDYRWPFGKLDKMEGPEFSFIFSNLHPNVKTFIRSHSVQHVKSKAEEFNFNFLLEDLGAIQTRLEVAEKTLNTIEL